MGHITLYDLASACLSPSLRTPQPQLPAPQPTLGSGLSSCPPPFSPFHKGLATSSKVGSLSLPAPIPSLHGLYLLLVVYPVPPSTH